MPYIEQSNRPAMDEIIKHMVEAGVEANGDLNYILFKFAKYHIKPSYKNYKNYLGELNEACERIRDQILNPYEDIKEKENGPI